VADRDAEQFRVLRDGADDRDAEHEELRVVVPGFRRGLSRFSPASVAIDQLLCLPLPLIPANGLLVQQAHQPVTSRRGCAA